MEIPLPLAKLNLADLAEQLHQLQLIDNDETLKAAGSAGDGNMNYTLRVQTNRRSLIIKQSVPYVAKYPSIPAPTDRIQQEVAFYRFVAEHPKVANRMPQLFVHNKQHNVVVFQDCGDTPDYSVMYTQDTSLENDTLATLVDWLATLHAIPLSASETLSFSNNEMRQLNHFHIFDFPLNSNNGLDLDAICPGLKQVANKIQKNETFKQHTKAIGREVYLAGGTQLIHGDFFPGSILNTLQGPTIIDPEFCHSGRREFDLGVFYAHLHFAQASSHLAESFLAASHQRLPFDRALTQKIAGIEIMRRIIGVAQLPIDMNLDRRIKLLELAQAWVIS